MKQFIQGDKFVDEINLFCHTNVHIISYFMAHHMRMQKTSEGDGKSTVII